MLSVAQSPSWSCHTHAGLNKSSLSSEVAELVMPASRFLSAGRAREADLGRGEEEEIAHDVSILRQSQIHFWLHPLLPFCHLPLFLPGANTFPSCLIMFELRLGPMNQPETRAQKRGQGAPSGQYQCLTHSNATGVSPSTHPLWAEEWPGCPGEGEFPVSELRLPCPGVLLGSVTGTREQIFVSCNVELPGIFTWDGY